MSNAQKPSEPLRVLLVCTGNICRSPLAEQVLRQQFAKLGVESQVQISSAGTMALKGHPLQEKSGESMTELGYSPTEHRARQLTAEMLEEADLVLSATAEHRSEVAKTLISANKRSFTIPEFARIATFMASKPESLAELEPATTMQAKVQLAARYRGYAPPAKASEDIDDPWGQSYESYQVAAKQINTHARAITTWLGGQA